MSVLGELVSWPVALATAQERRKNNLLVAFAALTFLSAVGMASAGSDGSEILMAFGLAFFFALNLFLGAGLIDDELTGGHAQLVLLRPLTRASWFGGRLAGAGLVLFVCLLAASLLNTLAAMRAGASLHWARLLVVPVGFVWLFAWLSVLAAVSVVAKGWTNAGLVMLAGLGWLSLRLVAQIADALVKVEAGQLPWSRRINEGISAAAVYVSPQDPMAVIRQLTGGQHPDFAPVAYDLVWIAAAWLVGCWLLNGRELARRAS